MPTIQLFEDGACIQLHPFHLIDGVEAIRFGAYTQLERWRFLPSLLKQKGASKGVLKINARWVPSDSSGAMIAELNPGEKLVQGNDTLAFFESHQNVEPKSVETTAPQQLIRNANALFGRLEEQLLKDVALLKEEWSLAPFTGPPSTAVFGPASSFLVHSSAIIKAATVDVESGPVVIGPGAVVEAGAHLKGPLVICADATVRMAGRISGPTVIGPHCKVGGEISNVNFQGWANKAHDGFLGNSVIGRWCNLGAGTESSNLKNTYGEVRQWNAESQGLEGTGLQFCGLLMGDHSKCGIGTTFNTGTVIDPASVIFDAGFPPKHLPPFSWYNARLGTMEVQDLGRMLATAEKVMARRGLSLSTVQRDRLSQLHAARSTAD
jgi:UDP-N-acetylglucosamine diphosphorylase/glucosamine-1-phosphate N-acetyltransferase